MNLEVQFILQNAHFALNLFSAFVFFAIFWLYYDAWSIHKKNKDLFKFVGFAIISLSFLVSSMHVEQTILAKQLLGGEIFQTIMNALRICGYLILVVGLLTDPLQERPKYGSKTLSTPVAVGVGGVGISSFAGFLLAPFSAFVAFLFLRRSTLGLENHLKPIALTFFILSVSDLLSLSSFFRSSTNVSYYNLVAPFGILWVVEHLLLLVAIIISGRWVFTYLVKRIQTQLFMIFISSTMLIFLVTTVTFTSLLLNNLKIDALSRLKTDVSVLDYAIESRKDQVLSDAQLFAQNGQLEKALISGDRVVLKDLSKRALLGKNQGMLMVLSRSGEVLARGEDPDRVGGSLSNDLLVKRALRGENVVSVITRDGVLAPEVMINAAAPVGSGSGVLGVVVIGFPIDNAFVDGVRSSTGLDASVYGGNTRSASTYMAPDGKSRYTGIKEMNSEVNKIVLGDGEVLTTSVGILNIPYFAAYAPIKDINNEPVGMLFVGEEQSELLQTASKSTQLTFVISVILLVISVIPSFFISRYFANQFR